MSEIIGRLSDHRGEDHTRGWQGREYSCSCGYDIQTDVLLGAAKAEIERLTALKTPASTQLLNITKGCLDNAEAEIERLRAEHDDYVVRANANVCDLNQEIERLRADRVKVWEWMREPDHVEVATHDWLIDWVNRRPFQETALKDTTP